MKKVLFTLLMLVTALTAATAHNAGADCDAEFTFTVDGLTVSFSDNSTADPGPIIGWTWDFGDGTTSTEANPVHTYAAPGEYDVCLIIHADGDCYDDRCESNIPVGFGGGDCAVDAEVATIDGTSAQFIAAVSPDADIVTYTWTFGDGSSFTETTAGTPSDPWHTYAEPGVYTVCVVIETGAGCVDEFCFEIEIPGGGDCFAMYEFDTDGLAVHFFEAVAAATVEYVWDFGDGTTSTEANPLHTYSEPGSYLVCLTIFTAGCTDEFCDWVTVEEAGGDCISDFEFVADGTTVYFYETAIGGDVIEFVWDFGDGSTSFEENPVHEYATGGMYEVCLTIFTAGCTDTYCMLVSMDGGGGGDCESDFEFDEDGLTVHFFETADGGDIVSYEWSFGDGEGSDSPNPVHTYADAGTYIVCLTITTADGCESTFCDEVTVEGDGGPCEAFFEIVSIELTPDGYVVHFINESFATGDIVSVIWYFGDGTVAETMDAAHVYTEGGAYVVCLQIVTADGCTDEYCFELSLTDAEDCESDFDFETDGMMAIFEQDADGAGADIVSYMWNFGDGTTSDTPDPEHIYTSEGDYEVCLTITTGDGCVDTWCDVVTIESEDECTADFEVDGITETPDGWIVEFDNDSDGTEIYHWNFGDGSDSEAENPEHLFTESGVYLVCLTVGIPGTTCFDEFCMEVHVGGGDDCILEDMIDSTYACTEEYAPVCGCDGITYSNACYAQFYGGVVYWEEGACAGTGVQEENIFGNVVITPNPAQNQATITYSLHTATDIRISITNTVGQLVSPPIEHFAAAGNYTVATDVTQLASGLYIVHISGGGAVQTAKLLISK